MRAPFQVLVFPYRRTGDGFEFAAFHRADMQGVWQGIAGGGEDEEVPIEAAIRETTEEAGLPSSLAFVTLASSTTIPVEWVGGFHWGGEVLVIPEYTFGVDVGAHEIRLSDEHTEFRWSDHKTIAEILTWDSNRSALWELNWRLTH